MSKVKNALRLPIPGREKSSLDRMVASRSTTTPHMVCAVKGCVFKCDSQCPMFTAHKICHHVVAVAETHSKLKELVCYHCSGHMDPNMTSLVMIGASTSAGQKPGNQTTKKNEHELKNQVQL